MADKDEGDSAWRAKLIPLVAQYQAWIRAQNSKRSSLSPSNQQTLYDLLANATAAPHGGYLSLEVLFERLPINLAALNKGHLLQHDNSYGHLPWLQEGTDKILNLLLRDSSL